jgi:hypothetical protein
MTRIINYKEMYKYGQLEMCFFYKYLQIYFVHMSEMTV